MAKPGESSPPPSGLDFIILIVLFMAIAPMIGGFLIYLGNPSGLLTQVRDYLAPFFIHNLWWIKILSVLISGLLLWGIVHILSKLNYANMRVEQFLNILGSSGLSRRRSLRAWRQIQARLATEDPQQWKIAILEADEILDEVLKLSGYLGKMEDKLDLITPAQLASIEDIKTAHRIRNQISGSPAFELSREVAERAAGIYKRAFVETNLISE